MSKIEKTDDRQEAKQIFIRRNFKRFTNPVLASKLRTSICEIRKICYHLGLKRMKLEYFSPEQVKYLVRNYKAKGDVELAEIFQRKWPKQKGWTKKHIEKKRKYLNLQRTIWEIKAIHLRNVKAGRFKICPIKAWDKRGRAQEGEIRYWTNNFGVKYPVIKFNGKFVHWARYTWEKHFGSIPKHWNIIFKDGNPQNLNIENLELISNEELARRDSQKSSKGLSDNYIAGILSHGDVHARQIIKEKKGLIEVKRKQLLLNRTIYELKGRNNIT